MSLPCVLLTGSSHVVSIRNAQALRIASGAATFDLVDVELFPKFDPLLKVIDGKFVMNEGIEPALREIVETRSPKLVVGALWGDQHFFMSTANFPRRLDFVLPGEPSLPLDPRAELVPYDALYALIRHHFGLAKMMAATLKRLTAAPLVLVPAPAPVKDFSTIPRGSSNPEIDLLVADHGAAPAHLRYKFWRLVAAVHDELAAATPAEAFPLPQDTVDAEGFRLPAFHSTDWIHANSDHGERVLRQIDARLAQT